ncbi:MAG: FMN-binding glutamate synthase family protein [Polyangiales bacterium]
MIGLWIFAGVLGFLLLVAIHDRFQKTHTIVANFPIVGRFRFWFEQLGAPLRQYIVTSNDEERPFSRDQRRWIYASSKKENNYFGFGTDNDLELTPGYIIIRQSAFPTDAPHDALNTLPCAKILGGARKRKKAFRPTSIVNTSAMSYGSLSSAAVEAINKGVKIAGAMQNTGEGGISDHHRHGGDLIWQIGTGYFGCRDDNGKFSLEKFLAMLETANVRAIEIKLSQGAKPGLGGVLPAAKITAEIAKIRLIPRDRDCISPASHTAFNDVSSMIDFIEMIAEKTGLPVGIKSAVGEMSFWKELAHQMATTKRGPDFITIDGGEGGTGAAPLVFTDHVSLPFKLGFSSVYRVFAEQGIHEDVVFIGSGKLGFPQQAMLALALGCDMVNVAREAMLSIGCIQAQQCHTGHCPTGIASQQPWLVKGLDPTVKSARLANYLITLRKELISLSHACGELHPALVPLERFEIVDGFSLKSAREVFAYQADWGHPKADEQYEIRALMKKGFATAA